MNPIPAHLYGHQRQQDEDRDAGRHLQGCVAQPYHAVHNQGVHHGLEHIEREGGTHLRMHREVGQAQKERVW